jgi:hypothetical protein
MPSRGLLGRLVDYPTGRELGSNETPVSGIIGPLLAGLLIPLAGASFIFGANGLVEQSRSVRDRWVSGSSLAPAPKLPFGAFSGAPGSTTSTTVLSN